MNRARKNADDWWTLSWHRPWLMTKYPKLVSTEFGKSNSFGTAEQVREVGQYVDGVIVGAALIRAAGDAPDPAQAAYDFVHGLAYWQG